MSDYYIDATNGSTLWKYQRTFPAYSEACNIDENFYFIANGQTARKEGKQPIVFLKYNPEGKGFTEIGQPPYNQQYASYIVVPYLERGPMIGPTGNEPSNQTFLGLFNLSLDKWVLQVLKINPR